MSLLSWMRRGRKIVTDPTDDHWGQIIAVESDAGIEVDESTAISGSAVLCALRHFGEQIGQMPIQFFRYTDEAQESRERARDYPLYELLRYQPNPMQTAMEFKERMQATALAVGVAYAEIEYDRAGRIIGLWQLASDRISLKSDGGGRYWYEYKAGGQSVPLEPWRVFCLPGFALRGLLGLNLLDKCKAAIGTSLAQERFAARFFKNGATPGGLLTTPMKMSREARNALARDWQATYGGLDNAFRVAVLEQDMKWQSVAIAPEQAQMIQSREFQVLEVCRVFNITPSLLFHLAHQGYRSLEQLDLSHLKYSIAPWLERWVQRIRMHLIPEQDRKTYFAEFNTDALMRTDMATRYQAHNAAINGGWKNRNEVRRLENLNPQPGLDEFTLPKNIGVDGGGTPNTGAPDAEPDEQDKPNEDEQQA